MVDNSVTLIGRLVNHPKLFSTSTGKSKTFFAIATGRKDRVEFISCTAWDKVAEILDAYTDKGSEIAVEGHLVSRNKEVNGRQEYYLEVIVDSVKLLGGKHKEENSANEALKTIDDEILKLDADNLPF